MHLVEPIRLSARPSLQARLGDLQRALAHEVERGEAAGGVLGVGGGLRWNAAVGGAGGFVQTELNNWFHNQNKNVFLNTAISGLSGGAGYLAGDKTTERLIGQMQGSIKPVIAGNVLGAWVSEFTGAGFDQTQRIIDADKSSENK